MTTYCVPKITPVYDEKRFNNLKNVESCCASLACSIHTTWGPSFSPALCIQTLHAYIMLQCNGWDNFEVQYFPLGKRESDREKRQLQKRKREELKISTFLLLHSLSNLCNSCNFAHVPVKCWLFSLKWRETTQLSGIDCIFRSHPDGPAAYRFVENPVKNCFHHKPGWFWAHSRLSYVKKIPVVCTMDGLNGFAFLQHMTELSSMKVQTLTLGRPVVIIWVWEQKQSEPRERKNWSKNSPLFNFEVCRARC